MLIEWMRQSTNKAMLIGAAEAFMLKRYEQEENIEEMFRLRSSSDGESLTLADIEDVLARCGLKPQSGFVEQLSVLLGFAHPSEVRLDFQGYRGFLSLVAQRIGYAKETARARAAYFDQDDANRLHHVNETRVSATMDADSLHRVAKVLGFDLSPSEEAALEDLSSAAPPMGRQHGGIGGRDKDDGHDNGGGIEDGRLRLNRRHERPTFGGAPSDAVEDGSSSGSEYSLDFEDDADDATGSDARGRNIGNNGGGERERAEGIAGDSSARDGADESGSEDCSMWSTSSDEVQNDEHGEDNNRDEEVNVAILSKRFKKSVSDISKHLICPITQELMVDPVVADDENTYERTAILDWMETNGTSPLDPSRRLNSSRLVSVRAVKLQAEQLVSSGELDEVLCVAYFERRRRMVKIDEEFDKNDDEEQEDEQEEDYGIFESHAEDSNPAARIVLSDGDESALEQPSSTQKRSRGVENGRSGLLGLPRIFDSRRSQAEGSFSKQRDVLDFNGEAFARALHSLGRQQLVEEINIERRARELEIKEAFHAHAIWVEVKEDRGSTTTSTLLVLNRSGWKNACALLNLTWQDDILDRVVFHDRRHLIYFSTLLRRLHSNAFFAGVIAMLAVEAFFVDVKGQYIALFFIFEFVLRMRCYCYLGWKNVSRQHTIVNTCDGVALLIDVIFLYCSWNVGPGAKSITAYLETFRDDLPIKTDGPVSELIARGLRAFLRSCGRIFFPLGIFLFVLLWLCYARLRRLCGYAKDPGGGLENEENSLRRGEVGIDEETFRRYISAMAMRSASAWPQKKFRDVFLSHISSDGASVESTYLSELLQDLRYSCTPAEIDIFGQLAKGRLRNRICFDDFVLASKLLCDNMFEADAFEELESRRHTAIRALQALVTRSFILLATLVGEFCKDLANLTTNLYILATAFYSEDILESKLQTYVVSVNVAVGRSPFSAILSPVTGLLGPLFSIISFFAGMVSPNVDFEQGVTCSGVTALIGK